MAPLTPVRALALPVVPERLQQHMRLNRSSLEKAGLWEFLLWARDDEKKVNEDKVTRFVGTYSLKMHMDQVHGSLVTFSTQAISKVTALPASGEGIEGLIDLRYVEAEQIFGPKLRWGKDTMWDCSTSRDHWRAWFELVNSYLLFRPATARME